MVYDFGAVFGNNFVSLRSETVFGGKFGMFPGVVGYSDSEWMMTKT